MCSPKFLQAERQKVGQEPKLLVNMFIYAYTCSRSNHALIMNYHLTLPPSEAETSWKSAQHLKDRITGRIISARHIYSVSQRDAKGGRV
jgi:hypothetical protein